MNSSTILEISERPKSIIIERLCKNNKWVMIRKFYNPEGYGYLEIIRLANSFKIRYNHQEIRILNGAKWQIYNTKMTPFYKAIDEDCVFSVKELNEEVINAKLMTFKQFVKWFRETSKAEKGFTGAKHAPIKEDDYLWFKLSTNERVYSVAPYSNFALKNSAAWAAPYSTLALKKSADLPEFWNFKKNN